MSELPIIPKPTRAQCLPGEFSLVSDVRISASKTFADAGRELSDIISSCTGSGVPLQVQDDDLRSHEKGSIYILSNSNSLGPEAYTIEINWFSVKITAGGVSEAYYAIQGWLISQISDFLSSKERLIVGWDENIDGGFPEGAIIMLWRDIGKGISAIKAGFDVVMTPNEITYFDTNQSADTSTEPLANGRYLSLEKVYEYEPIDQSLSAGEARHVLGVQGQIWTEYLPTAELIEYMTFLRVWALAEIAWSSPNEQNYAEFLKRLHPFLFRLGLLGINYRHPEIKK